MAQGCRYYEYQDELAGRLAVLSERARTAVFWLWGVGLGEGLLTPDKWVAWLEEAKVVGRRHALGQEWLVDGARLRESWRPISPPEEDMSGQLLCTIGCFLASLSSDPPGGDPCMTDDVLTPVMVSASMDVDETVAWPAFDEEIDVMFAADRVQAAVAYVDRIVEVLASNPEPDEALLDELLVGAGVLSPPPGYDV